MKRLMRYIPSSYSGFTIVELLTVIGIIGLLTTAILATLDPIGQIQKGRDGKRKSDLAQLQRAIEVYYQDHGFYPPDSGNGTTGGCYYQIVDGGTCIAWGGGWLPYMAKLPKDSSTGYRYVYYSTGQAYYLYASLERGVKDPQVCNSDGSACPNALSKGVTCGLGTQICNFGISSPNTTP